MKFYLCFHNSEQDAEDCRDNGAPAQWFDSKDEAIQAALSSVFYTTLWDEVDGYYETFAPCK